MRRRERCRGCFLVQAVILAAACGSDDVMERYFSTAEEHLRLSCYWGSSGARRTAEAVESCQALQPDPRDLPGAQCTVELVGDERWRSELEAVYCCLTDQLEEMIDCLKAKLDDDEQDCALWTGEGAECSEERAKLPAAYREAYGECLMKMSDDENSMDPM